MIPSDRGLIVHRASRTERLAEQLAVDLEVARPKNPLHVQTVVVAHPGLRRWLLGEFARRRDAHGGHGIAANFDMIEPWQWLERTTRRVLGDSAPGGITYRQEFLRWSIFRALPTVDAAQLSAYLAGVDGERRRFQLAEHLSSVYTQYLIYRRDWILEWERGPMRGEHWQATVWRKVQAMIGGQHRAQRHQTLCVALAARGDDEDSPLHVFGVSHLPPDILTALQALAQRRCVRLYFPDPCREYWSDLRARREALKKQVDADALYYEVGHPLLVSLGRMAQDFCIALDDADAQIERDRLDEAEPLEATGLLLASLQSSIRCCQPDLVGHLPGDNVENAQDSGDRLQALRIDASLRVHVCHTRLRELEVLKDAVLRALADDDSLQHRDIVVMAPAMAAYAPYLPAVFGAAARYDPDPTHLPWHLADVGLGSVHPLMSAFLRLLDLAESRFTVSAVLDFLSVPAVARRFDVDNESRETLERAVRRAHIAWGLDADMKSQAGAAAIDANSWQFGLDRMYAGLVLGNVTQAFDGILPLQGVDGSTAEALGQIDRLLGELREVRAGAGLARPLEQWRNWLLERIDAIFLADARDDDEQGALDSLRRLISQFVAQADAVGHETILSWSVVRDALRGMLADVSERQPFLLGGITFCGLVPQRSIPFRVVCLIGMNEGEFPRINGDDGLNRMLAEPRSGDRNTRNEDRYLFLEALMSARDRLHISYIGEGVHDARPRNPASPLAELLQFLAEQHGLDADDASPRPWLVRHPLQAFDARYFRQDNADPRLFSYARLFANSAVSGTPTEPFLDPTTVPVTPQLGGETSLIALKQYWRDPARDVLSRGASLSLAALDGDHWSDREPMEARVDPRERIDRRLLFEAITAGDSDVPATPPSWLALSGALASGVAGEQAYATARDNAATILAAARDLLGDSAQRVSQPIDLDLGEGVRLSGVVEGVFRTRDGKWCLFDAKPSGSAGFRELLPFYIDLAALRLSGNMRVQPHFVENAEKSTISSARKSADLLALISNQTDDQLREGLHRLVRASQLARTQPALYFPKTAWAWTIADADRREHEARKVWHGGFERRGERDYAPGYASLLCRDLDFLDPGSLAHTQFVSATELVVGVLDPQREVLLRSAKS